jgi:UDP-GlcNAc:undecaprenyl-phosphate GlcNAc-1-phosphate transferase
MRSFVAAFLVAATVGAILTPLVSRLALRVGAVSRPGGRNVNERVIPRLGGVAIALAFFAPLILLFFVESAVADSFTSNGRRVVGLFTGGVIMCGVGFVDDLRGIRALYKLFAQIAVASLAFACGFRIDTIALPLVNDAVSIGPLGLPVTIVWIVGIINAVNLIDGLDGLAAGVVFFACVTLFTVGFIGQAVWVCLLMAATMGAVVGFLFHNFNPARIFMGDSGSYFLGFVLAATSLAGGPRGSTPVALLVPIVALGVPIFDVLLAMVRRILERRSIFSPDRGHLHHRLLDMGLTHRRAVLIIYGVSLVFTCTAIALYIGRWWQMGVALLVSFIVLIGLARLAGFADYFRQARERRGFMRTLEVDRLRRLVPRLPQQLRSASNTNEVFEVLTSFCADAEITKFSLSKPATQEVVREILDGHLASDAKSSFKLRSLTLVVAWRSEHGEANPQSEMLIQMVVDAFEEHLVRVDSELLAVETEERPSSTELRSA